MSLRKNILIFIVVKHEAFGKEPYFFRGYLRNSYSADFMDGFHTLMIYGRGWTR